MDETIIQDFKEFITVTVSQQTTDIRGDIKGLDSKLTGLTGEIKNLDVKLSQKIDDLSDSVAEAINNSNEAVDSQLKDHETRISTLEHKPT